MNIPALLCGLGCSGAAIWLFRRAKSEFSIKQRAGQLTLTRIRDITPGLCMTAGEVLCDTPLYTPYSKTPAVWYRYEAFERRAREEGVRQPDQSLASGNQCCPFVLKDETGEIKIIPEGGTAISYPHHNIMKSQSGKRTPLRDRIKKLKAADRQKYSEGQKKPFFRKIEMDDEPLDIPDDLIELIPGSVEAKKAHRTYREEWIQSGDYVYIMGSATENDGTSIIINKPDTSTPFLISSKKQKITISAFQKNSMVFLLAGLGFGVVSTFLLLLGVDIL